MRVVISALGLLLVLSTAATAAVPDPAQSFIPPCVATCPLGDIPFVVVVRDIANNPVAGALVELITCECPEVRYCPPNTDCIRTTVSDANGTAQFVLQSGGAGTCGVVLRADGVTLRIYDGVGSVDQNGDSFVTPADEAILFANMGSTNPRYDVSCDAYSDETDQAIVRGHFGHSCDGVVPTVAKTWGAVKSIYR